MKRLELLKPEPRCLIVCGSHSRLHACGDECGGVSGICSLTAHFLAERWRSDRRKAAAGMSLPWAEPIWPADVDECVPHVCEKAICNKGCVSC